MNRFFTIRSLVRNIAVLVPVFGLCLAQPGRRLESVPDRSLVAIVHVKPEMLNEWLELQKRRVVPALKKSGVKTRTVYGSGVFGRAFEFMIVQPMNKFAEFDSAEAQAEAIGSVAENQTAEKIRKCLGGASSFLSTALPELSNPGEITDPPVIGFLHLRVTPGRMQEYQDTFKSTVLPAMKKANANVSAASWRLGTDGYDLIFATPMNQFADLDAPPRLVRTLGAEGAAKLTASLNALAMVVENTILVRQRDLSF